MSNILDYNVNPDSPIPVYVQIENLVQFSIISKKITAGDTLPSVRNLSSELTINPNTVTKAYRDLELRGIVGVSRGVGVIVTDNALSLCKKMIQEQSKAHLLDAVAECLASGYSAKEIRKMVTNVVDSKRLPYTC